MVVEPADEACALGEAAIVKSGMHDRIAAFAFRRPPVSTLPVRTGIASTVDSSVDFSVAVSIGQRESTSAAVPDTCGTAIDVPLKY